MKWSDEASDDAVSELPTSVICSGCDRPASRGDPLPFRCRWAEPGDDIDHVMVRSLDPARLRFPSEATGNPFLRYRRLFHSYHLARSKGWSDAQVLEVIRELDSAVREVDGRGFTITPFTRNPELSALLGFADSGGVWVKDETANVSGSHKARHLMGLMLHLQIVQRTGLAAWADRELAIASCGNAALAAAVVSRAAGRPLRVFVPTWADPDVVSRLRRLGAEITVCPRANGEHGDPTYRELHAAVAAGALPFTCQGSENGLTIEGGETLGFEMVSELALAGDHLDHLVIQVGGGALGSSTVQAFRDAISLGASVGMPTIHAAQTAAAHPLKRALDRLVDRMRTRSEGPARALAHARSHRSEFMWPWEEEPKSAATGILDDETYDWRAVVEGIVTTGGAAVTVSEEELMAANELARQTSEATVSHTGSAGLAGLTQLTRSGVVGPAERVGIIFTG